MLEGASGLAREAAWGGRSRPSLREGLLLPAQASSGLLRRHGNSSGPSGFHHAAAIPILASMLSSGYRPRPPDYYKLYSSNVTFPVFDWMGLIEVGAREEFVSRGPSVIPSPGSGLIGAA